jgi:hypothetical protein
MSCQLFKNLSDWQKPIEVIKKTCKNLMIPQTQKDNSKSIDSGSLAMQLSTQDPPIFACELPTEMTPAQREAQATFSMLYRATVNQELSVINQVLLNIELLAFAFIWYSQVSCYHMI